MSTVLRAPVLAFVRLVSAVYALLWNDLLTLPLPGGGTLGLPLLVMLLVPTGAYFTLRTRVLPVRLLPAMARVAVEKRPRGHASLSGVQSLIVSTATRVGMGNLVGVVAAISAGESHALRSLSASSLARVAKSAILTALPCVLVGFGWNCSRRASRRDFRGVCVGFAVNGER